MGDGGTSITDAGCGVADNASALVFGAEICAGVLLWDGLRFGVGMPRVGIPIPWKDDIDVDIDVERDA